MRELRPADWRGKDGRAPDSHALHRMPVELGAIYPALDESRARTADSAPATHRRHAGYNNQAVSICLPGRAAETAELRKVSVHELTYESADATRRMTDQRCKRAGSIGVPYTFDATSAGEQRR